MNSSTSGRRADHNGSAAASSRPRLLRLLGPGLISGASDNDPAAVASYSQAGARFGYQLCWVAVLCFPLMVVVQEISARVGRTTGCGIAANLRRHYSAWAAYPAVLLLLLANIVAITADLAAMADVMRLMIGGAQLFYVVLAGVACASAQIFMRYSRYVAVLKWTTLSLLAYPAALLLTEVNWTDVAAGLVPRFSLEGRFVTTVVAIFGVALSPYIFFWQASQEAENQRVAPSRKPLVRAPEQAPRALERIRVDTWLGMFVAIAVGLSIMVTAGATLHAAGTSEIQSSAQAAEALKPVGGAFAFFLFAAGILGTGLLAVPVLAGSAGYAIGEALNWPVGLARRPLEAKAFYGTIALATCAGIALNVFGVEPMRALYWSAVMNGVVAAPVLALMLLIASRRSVMGSFTISRPLRIVGWIATAVITACILAMAIGFLVLAF